MPFPRATTGAPPNQNAWRASAENIRASGRGSEQAQGFEGRLKGAIPPGKWTVLSVGQTVSGLDSEVPPWGSHLDSKYFPGREFTVIAKNNNADNTIFSRAPSPASP
jgi:hypothetical protein